MMMPAKLVGGDRAASCLLSSHASAVAVTGMACLSTMACSTSASMQFTLYSLCMPATAPCSSLDELRCHPVISLACCCRASAPVAPTMRVSMIHTPLSQTRTACRVLVAEMSSKMILKMRCVLKTADICCGTDMIKSVVKQAGRASRTRQRLSERAAPGS